MDTVQPTVQCLCLHVSGHVQGVGFRMKTVQLSKGFEVTGIVSNLMDGRVYLEAEGERAEIEAFRDEITEQLSPFIRTVEQAWVKRPRTHKGFTIV